MDPETGGGTAERTYQLTRYLIEENCSVTLVSNDIGESETVAKNIKGADYLILPTIFKRFPVPYSNLGRLFYAVKNCDLVHLMSHWTVLNVVVYLFTRWHNKKLFVCPAGSLNNLGRSRVLKKAFTAIVGKKILKSAQARIIISPTESEDIEKNVGVKLSCDLIPNGIVFSDYNTDEEEDFFEKFHIPKSNFILFLGRLSPIKGPDLLLEAFAKIHNSIANKNLVFAGPSQEGIKEKIVERAMELGIENKIFFTGYIHGKDKVLALKNCDYLVIPSRKEAMSIVVLEAGALGKTVVLTDQCGLNELAVKKMAVLTTLEPQNIGEGILKMESLDYVQMGEQFKSYVQDKYTWNKVVKEHLKIFQRDSAR